MCCICVISFYYVGFEIYLHAHNELLYLGLTSPPSNKYVERPSKCVISQYLLECRNYRYAAYGTCSYLLAGRLGRKRRRPLPACLG